MAIYVVIRDTVFEHNILFLVSDIRTIVPASSCPVDIRTIVPASSCPVDIPLVLYPVYVESKNWAILAASTDSMVGARSLFCLVTAVFIL